MTALQQLAEKIHAGRTAGLLPAEYVALVDAALAETAAPWESEKAFRLRTGASDKWCRQHFAEMEAQDLARRNERGRREWHRHARTNRHGRLVSKDVKREIVRSFQRRSA